MIRLKKTFKFFAYDFGHTYAIAQPMTNSKFMILTTFHGSKPSPLERSLGTHFRFRARSQFSVYITCPPFIRSMFLLAWYNHVHFLLCVWSLPCDVAQTCVLASNFKIYILSTQSCLASLSKSDSALEMKTPPILLKIVGASNMVYGASNALSSSFVLMYSP